MEYKTESLYLFDEKQVQVDITGDAVAEYHPLTSLRAGGPIEFHISGAADECIDLNDIQLLVRMKITKNDNKKLDATDIVAFINKPISSLFQDVFVTSGDKQGEGGQHCYPYNSYHFSSLLEFHASPKKTHMEAWGWNEDETGEFDSDTNEGFKLRAIETALPKGRELNVSLFLDITRQSRFLLPQTDLCFKFLPAKADFVLQDISKAKNNYLYNITKATLYLRRMRFPHKCSQSWLKESEWYLSYQSRGHQYIHCH